MFTLFVRLMSDPTGTLAPDTSCLLAGTDIAHALAALIAQPRPV